MNKEDQGPIPSPEALGEVGDRPPEGDGITDLLAAWGEGDPIAGEELMRRVADRLQKLASSFLRKEREDHTLQTLELINEAYLRLVQQDKVNWHHRNHFFAITGRMMRRILVDHARRRAFTKRGGQMVRLPEEVLEQQPVATPDEKLVDLDVALDALAQESPELAAVVELRYFVGLTGEEIAASLGVSTPTVQRRWQTARAWLYRELKNGTTRNDPGEAS